MGKGIVLKLDEIKRDLGNFFTEMAEETYLNVSGLKAESNLSPIYEKYVYLPLLRLVESNGQGFKGE